jgi:hypothetical protein
MLNPIVFFSQVYCGPVPQIDNGFAVAATNVSFGGTASFQCYAGFAFPSGLPIETISCNADGTWGILPICQGNFKLISRFVTSISIQFKNFVRCH